MNSSNLLSLLLPCFQDYVSFKKSLKYLNDIFYQMDNIWEAPSRLKKSQALIFLKKSAIILRQDFLKTL